MITEHLKLNFSDISSTLQHFIPFNPITPNLILKSYVYLCGCVYRHVHSARKSNVRIVVYQIQVRVWLIYFLHARTAGAVENADCTSTELKTPNATLCGHRFTVGGVDP